MSQDKINWKEEAQGVISDISRHVTQINISETIKDEESRGVYINLQTLEGDKHTINLNTSGFAIVGNGFDNFELDNKDGAKSFETIYALLQSISPRYVSSFAEGLQAKLEALSNQEDRK